MNLLNLPIGAAISTSVTPAAQLMVAPRNLVVQGKFAYGAGGTTVDAWLQTSVDGGQTWTDIAQFHFTTAAARFLYNLNGQTAVSAEYTATDGTLASNTSKDGILGPQLRVKYSSTGTYTGATNLSIDVACNQVMGNAGQ